MNALVLVRRGRLRPTRKIMKPFPVIVRTEKAQPRTQNRFPYYDYCMITLYLGYDQYPSSMKAPALILLSGVLTYPLNNYTFTTRESAISLDWPFLHYLFQRYSSFKRKTYKPGYKEEWFYWKFYVRRFNLFLCASFFRVYFDINEVGKL